MDHRSQRRKESSGWWRREKAYRYLRPAACDLVSMGRAHHPGNDQFGERCNFSRKTLDDTYVTDRPIGENSFSLEINRNLSKTCKGKPMKVVEEEIQKDKETRHPSPSVIARLMGLDALPPQIVHDKRSEMHNYFQKTSGHQYKHVFHDYCSSGKVRNECQEFKDVFEIMETSKVEKNSGKRLTKGLETSKGSDTHIELIRQRFTYAKDFSNNETIDDSEASNDVSQVLDHDKALAMKFLQEPNSSIHPTDITILKPSISTKHKGCELRNTSGRRAERCALVQKDHSTQKPASSLGNFSQVEHNKMSKSQYADKMGNCINPTQIVILKPSLEKAEKSDEHILLSSSLGNFITHDRGHAEFRSCRAKSLNAEGRDWPKFNPLGTTENKAKSSSEMGRNISKVMGNDASRDIERILASRFNKYISSDNSIDYMSQMTHPKNYKAAQRSFNDFTERHKTVSELSVNREGRRRLSQRWKTSHQFGDMARSDRSSNTLAEMLSLSDKELLKKITDSSITRKISGEKLARHGMLAERSCSPATSNRVTSKDGCNFPISTHPASSSIGLRNNKVSRRGKPGAYDNYSTLNDVLSLGTYSSVDENLCQRGRFTRRKSKCCSNVPCSCTSGKPEYKLDSRDAHVHSEFSNKFNMRNLHEGNSRLHDDAISHKNQLLDNGDSNLLLLNYEDQVSCNKLESGSPVRLKELEHPSPVSVLEQPASEGENYTTGCFDGVNVDLQGLRTQLQLLKLESEDTDVSECGILVLSNDDTGGGVHRSPIEELRGMLEELKDEEDREFSYLVDVLIDSGIGCANWDRIFDACYMPEYPVCPDVFEKLEKKYGIIAEWSSSERKLLFDLINIVLTEILAPCLDLHPWVTSKKKFGPMCARERLVEETWLMIARLRKKLSRGNPEDKVLDPMWFDIGNDIDLIGREIEGLLKEELLQELVTDFI